MSRKRLINRGCALLMVLMVAAISSSCSPSGSGAGRPSVIIVDRSRAVQLTEPNKLYQWNSPGIWMQRGRYIELVEIEQAVKAGRLIWAR